MSYILQLNDDYSHFLWEVDLLSSEPNYVRKKPEYKLLSTGVNIDFETNILQWKFTEKNSLENSILKRSVIIEKTGYKAATIYGDPIIHWVYQQLFSSNLFSNVRNFRLFKLNEAGTIISSWLLSECVLIDSTIWTNGSKFVFNESITVKPNVIFKCD